MVEIKEKENCCGCSACAQICPKHCISMREDNEGFLYPIADAATCVDCGLCEKVCPEQNPGESPAVPKAYAAKAKDDIVRLSSSSGGIFTLVAEKVLDARGVVFGCAFNDKLEAEHIFVEDKESLLKLRGSKYIQSRIGNSFSAAEAFLRDGREVLFSGTPCQIAGLKKYLRKEYDNLLVVEVMCHGAPSPDVWHKYVEEKFPEANKVSFREKKYGWKHFHFEVNGDDYSECYTDNEYMRLFLDNVILRPSCYFCKFKSGKSGSDITLGDFWGIENVLPEFDDDKGSSVVLVNSGKGGKALDELDIEMVEVDFSSAVSGNPAYTHSVRPHINRAYFFSELRRSGSFSKSYERLYDESLVGKIRHKLFRIIGL